MPKIVKPVRKKIADESWEFLKTAEEQIGLKKTEAESDSQAPASPEQKLEEKKEKDIKRSQSQVQALEQEIADIRAQRKQREEGWQAEQEEKMKQGSSSAGGEKPLIEPQTKRKRGLFSGIKTRVERLKRSSETRLPPSG
jgi:flagellar biosynthesis/type III secretory pathway protein FliH